MEEFSILRILKRILESAEIPETDVDYFSVGRFIRDHRGYSIHEELVYDANTTLLDEIRLMCDDDKLIVYKRRK